MKWAEVLTADLSKRRGKKAVSLMACLWVADLKNRNRENERSLLLWDTMKHTDLCITQTSEQEENEG